MTDITPEQQQKLQELSEALQSEFRLSSTQAVSRDALQDLIDLKSDMLEALRHTLRHSVNESLKAKTAMWGYEKLLEEGRASKDPLAELLAHMPTTEPIASKRNVSSS